MSKADKTLQVTSCGAVVWRQLDDNLQILLIKQFAHKDRWSIPKGHLNPNESHETCAIREVREETGLQVVLGEPLPKFLVRSKNEEKTVVPFFAQQVGDALPGSVDPDCEVAAAQWFSVDELPQIIESQKQFISSAIKTLRFRLLHWQPTYQK